MTALWHLFAGLVVLGLLPAPGAGGPAGQKPDGSLPNMWCLSWHCSGTMYRCMTELRCRAGLFCLQACATNSTCAFECIYGHLGPQIESFLGCAVTKNPCVELKAESPPYRCSPAPATGLKDSPELRRGLVGKWKVVGGRNTFHDCAHACRTMRIEEGTGGDHLQVLDEFAFAGEAGPTPVKVKRVLQLRPDGLHRADYRLSGLRLKEEWTVIGAETNSLRLHYCGHLGAWEYDGELLLQREGTSSSEASDSGHCRVNHNVNGLCTDPGLGEEL